MSFMFIKRISVLVLAFILVAKLVDCVKPVDEPAAHESASSSKNAELKSEHENLFDMENYRKTLEKGQRMWWFDFIYLFAIYLIEHNSVEKSGLPARSYEMRKICAKISVCEI